jgi:sugar phosphate isomerase/epimerase
MDRLGIELLGVFGLPPVDHVNLAADLGCGHISAGPGPMPWNPLGFAPWSLRDDAALRRQMKAALRDRGVAISVAEGFAIRPGADVADRGADLDLFADLGAGHASAVSMEPDRPRALAQLARLAEMCTQRGMGLVLEFAPPHPIGALDAARAAIAEIGRSDVKLVIDAMHLFRSGGTVAELAALDPGEIGHVQICDVPLAPPHGDYMKEACFNRLAPGSGELPLADFLAALPRDIPIGLETPQLAALETGEDLRTIFSRGLAAARALLPR